MLPTCFPFQIFVLGGGKHRVKEEDCSLDNSFWQRGARSHFLPEPLNEGGNNQKTAKAALLRASSPLGQFQVLLPKTQAGQSGQEGKVN